VRLLVVSPFAPRADARHGGARALAAGVIALAERHEVALVHLQDGEGVDDGVRNAVTELHELAAPAVSGARRLEVYAKLTRGTPVAVAERIDGAAVRRVREIGRQWQPDVVQFEFLVTTALLSAFEAHAAPRILVDHDATLRPVETFAHLPGAVARKLRALDARAWNALERAAAARVNAVVVFTDRDREALSNVSYDDVRVVPLVIPPRAQRHPAQEPAPPTLLFVGYYRHPPNADAARWLVEEIFPRVRAEHPHARLLLVGDELPAEIAARAGAGVEAVGRVADVGSYLEQAAVVVAPLRLGGGTRVKVLEALGAGKALVATPRAVEGIDAPAGEALIVASSAEELAHEISVLLGDPERRASLGAAAHAWASTELDARRTADRFDAIYADVLGRR
jgi:glycosyltransferase involved in cell wall biosynthesis